MKKYYWLYFVIMGFVMGCDQESASSDIVKTYVLHINPIENSNYYYGIINEMVTEVEVNGKEIENINRSDVSANYKISKDSNGTLLFSLKFDNINIYTKNGNNIKELNADNKLSNDPVVQLLGIMKETTFQSTLDSNGQSRVISGYKEISDKIIEAFPATDPATRAAIETQWNKTIGEKFVKQNTSQLFQVFPDTPVHAGSTWKISSTQQGELPVKIENLFTLKSINDRTAVIKSEGIVTNTNGDVNISGFGTNIKSNLKGQQEGEYEIETKTGMVLKSQIKANFKGTIQVIGREIPVQIKTSIKINGRKS